MIARPLYKMHPKAKSLMPYIQSLTNIAHSVLISDYNNLLGQKLRVKISHCFREANQCADKFTKKGTLQQQDFALWLSWYVLERLFKLIYISILYYPIYIYIYISNFLIQWLQLFRVHYKGPTLVIIVGYIYPSMKTIGDDLT